MLRSWMRASKLSCVVVASVCLVASGCGSSGTGNPTGTAGTGSAGNSGTTSSATGTGGASAGSGTGIGSGTGVGSGTGGTGVMAAGTGGTRAGTGGSMTGAAGAASSGGGTDTFTAVYAILQANCSGGSCHVGAFRPGAGLSLADKMTAYTNLVNANSQRCPGQKRVSPGMPNASVLVQALEHTGGCAPAMPQGRPALSMADLNTIVAWITAGAMNN